MKRIEHKRTSFAGFNAKVPEYCIIYSGVTSQRELRESLDILTESKRNNITCRFSSDNISKRKPNIQKD